MCIILQCQKKLFNFSLLVRQKERVIVNIIVMPRTVIVPLECQEWCKNVESITFGCGRCVLAKKNLVVLHVWPYKWITSMRSWENKSFLISSEMSVHMSVRRLLLQKKKTTSKWNYRAFLMPVFCFQLPYLLLSGEYPRHAISAQIKKKRITFSIILAVVQQSTTKHIFNDGR